MIAINLPLARRLALGVVLGQAAVTVCCMLASWLVSGSHAAASALLGGGISILASLAMALIAFGAGATTDPYRALRAFLLGEAAKAGVIVALFALVLKTLRVDPLPMLATYIATFTVFWVVLAKATPARSRGAHRAALNSSRGRAPS